MGSFKDLFMWMYAGFPDRKIDQETIDSVLKNKDDVEMLIKGGYLAIEGNIYEGRKKWKYDLGPNALHLIDAWKTERLIKEIRNLNRKLNLSAIVVFLFGLLFLGLLWTSRL